MPINVQEHLPAIQWLRDEGIFVMTNLRAESQNIRPLKLGILNLMPNKEVTELQLLRLISQTPLQINIDLIRMKEHDHRNSDIEHLETFYKTFDEVKNETYDALIVTGAPVETLPFEEVDYWEELKIVLNWSKDNVTSSFFICWGAQAALNYFYRIPKIQYSHKLFGVYPQVNLQTNHWLLRGFDDVFYTPQSRYTGIDISGKEQEILVMASSEEIGETILMSRDESQVFVLGHAEYDTDTLNGEYQRDLEKGLDIEEPKNYFTNGQIINNWRSHGYLLFFNWLNHVYQETPYDLKEIGMK